MHGFSSSPSSLDGTVALGTQALSAAQQSLLTICTPISTEQ